MCVQQVCEESAIDPLKNNFILLKGKILFYKEIIIYRQENYFN